jgi:PX-associated
MSSESPSTDLTPLRAHYLKKSLIQLQLAHELEFVTSPGPTNVSTLSYLGSPFTRPPKDAQPVDLPFLRYIFRQFVLTFPFMAAAPKDFYSQKLQPFVAALVCRNLSPTSILDNPDTDQGSRKKMVTKVERKLSHFLGGATKILEREEVVRLTQSDLDRLDLLSKKRQARLAKITDVFEVNIVSVRTVLDKGRIRNRVHDVCNQGFPYLNRS